MSRYDNLAASSGPIDVVAARGIKPGVHYQRPMHATEKFWRDPPPTVPFEHQPNNPQHVDLTGTKFGRFTVMGSLGPVGPSEGAAKGGKRVSVWLCRCACGCYEQRTSKRVKQPVDDDCCGDCRRVKYLKAGGARGPASNYRILRPPSD